MFTKGPTAAPWIPISGDLRFGKSHYILIANHWVLSSGWRIWNCCSGSLWSNENHCYFMHSSFKCECCSLQRWIRKRLSIAPKPSIRVWTCGEWTIKGWSNWNSDSIKRWYPQNWWTISINCVSVCWKRGIWDKSHSLDYRFECPSYLSLITDCDTLMHRSI